MSGRPCGRPQDQHPAVLQGPAGDRRRDDLVPTAEILRCSSLPVSAGTGWKELALYPHDRALFVLAAAGQTQCSHCLVTARLAEQRLVLPTPPGPSEGLLRHFTGLGPVSGINYRLIR